MVSLCTDCIGSAFNAKRLMQCPNCRKIEPGQWLCATSGHPIPDFNDDDWIFVNEDWVFAEEETIGDNLENKMCILQIK